MSLKSALYNYITHKDTVSIDELYYIGNGYKQSNVERKLRELVAERKVEVIKNLKRQIIGYRGVATPADDKKEDNIVKQRQLFNYKRPYED